LACSSVEVAKAEKEGRRLQCGESDSSCRHRRRKERDLTQFPRPPAPTAGSPPSRRGGHLTEQVGQVIYHCFELAPGHPAPVDKVAADSGYTSGEIDNALGECKQYRDLHLPSSPYGIRLRSSSLLLANMSEEATEVVEFVPASIPHGICRNTDYEIASVT